jgi:cell wall-associated NlpC family hydrolase
MGHAGSAAGPLSLIGTPFRDGGRDSDGLDCWGLVRLAFRQWRGIDLPAYGEISALDLLRVARAMSAGAEKWHLVATPQPWDVALLRGHGTRLACHVGLVTAAGLLHTEPATGAVVVPLRHLMIKHRIQGFFRYD